MKVNNYHVHAVPPGPLQKRNAKILSLIAPFRVLVVTYARLSTRTRKELNAATDSATVNKVATYY